MGYVLSFPSSKFFLLLLGLNHCQCAIICVAQTIYCGSNVLSPLHAVSVGGEIRRHVWWRSSSTEMIIHWFMFLPYSVCTECVFQG